MCDASFKATFDKVQNPAVILRIVMQMSILLVPHEGLLSDARKTLCSPFTTKETLTALYLFASSTVNQTNNLRNGLFIEIKFI
jgi:hypothetical protein